MLRAGGGVAFRVAEGTAAVREVEEVAEAVVPAVADSPCAAVVALACSLAAAAIFPFSARTSFSLIACEADGAFVFTKRCSLGS